MLQKQCVSPLIMELPHLMEGEQSGGEEIKFPPGNVTTGSI